MCDYGFIICKDSEGNGLLVEFCFNGWGKKFNVVEDNLVNQCYFVSMCKFVFCSSLIVVEGGVLEIDEGGYLLSIVQCLFNFECNGDMLLSVYEDVFKDMLGCSKVIIL